MDKRYETSYGVIPLKRVGNEWETLVIQLHAGHWGFPKGHPEVNEPPMICAERELFEETGLTVTRYIDPHPLKEKYTFSADNVVIFKTVYYYLAEVEGEVSMQEEELLDWKWVPLNCAESSLHFKGAKRLCEITRERIAYEEGDKSWSD